MNLVTFGSWTWLWETLNGLFLVICNLIYMLISLLYQVFNAVAKVNLFSDEVFKDITSRIYVVMGIAMLFIFAYNIILMIINPEDKKSTGSTAKVVKETVISLVLVILLPTIFSWMYTFQNNLLDSNIIGTLILGPVGSPDDKTENCNPNDYDCTCDFSKYGLENYKTDVHWYGDDIEDKTGTLTNSCVDYRNPYKMTASKRGAYAIAPTILSAFYKPTNFTFDQCVDYLQKTNSLPGDDEDKQLCVNYFYDVTASKYTGNITPFVFDGLLKNTVSDPDKTSMEFNWAMAIVAGGLAALMFFSYTIEVGVRVAKLGVLQLVSPIAVMMRIIPKQKEAMFDKWFKHLKDTYLDVFIRLIIIYFALFAISLVPDVIDTLWSSLSSSDGGTGIKTLALVFVILGILQFAKEAPNLLKDFFGNSGKFSVKGSLDKLKSNPLTNAVRGGVYGATTGKGWGRLGGFVSGAGRGAVGGYDKAVKGLDTARTERANGSRWYGRALDRARVGIGMETRADRDDRAIESTFHTSDRQKQNEAVMKQIKAVKTHVEEKLERENSKIKFHVQDASGNMIEGNYDAMKKYMDSLRDQVSNATNEADRAVAFKNWETFRDNLGAQKKQATENMVHALMNGSKVQVDVDSSGNPVYAFNDNDVSLVQAAVSEINKEITKGGVGIRYDDLGNEIANSEFTEQITSGFDLLGDFKDAIESQSYEIQRHSSSVSQNYSARHADSRMVRGNGQSEKK